MGTLPPSKQINKRTINFFNKGLNNNAFIKYFFDNCIHEKSSIMYKNLNKISHDLNVSLRELFLFDKNQLKDKYCVNDNWKSKIIKELMYCKEGQLLCNFTRNEIDHILNHILLF